MLVVKYNAAGVQQWGMFYDGLAHRYDIANSLVLDRAGNVYVAGVSTEAGPAVGDGSGLNITVIKFNPAGAAQWISVYNGPGNGRDYTYPDSLAVDRAGNVYVTGESQGTGTGLDFVTIKISAAGQRLWAARYNGPGGTSDRARALALDVFGNVYVTGYSNSGGDYTADFATVKYNPSGQQQWVARTSLLPESLDYPEAIAVDRRGNVFVTGETYPDAQAGVPPPATCGQDLLTVKYSPSGQPLWSKTYNGPGDCDDRLPKLAIDGPGNVYVAATSDGSGLTPGSSPPIFIGNDFVTLKYDGASGNEIWSRRFTSRGNVANPNDSVDGIALDLYGQVYVTGTSAAPGTDFDLVTVKYGADGSQFFESRFNIPIASRDFARALAVDRGRNFYVTGSTNLFGGKDLDMLTIKNTVNSTEPVAAFNWTPIAQVQGQPVQFQDLSTGSPTSWAWDFNGDLLWDSIAQSPAHTFANPGAYDVTLQIASSAGTQRVTETVIIESTTNVPYVQNVVRDYEGFFLQGTDLDNKFQANINWKGLPGTAAFAKNFGTPVVEPGNSAGASHTYDMMADFAAAFSASTVTITPTNGEATPISGLPHTESVWVFPFPAWLAVAGPFNVETSGGEVKWKYERKFPKDPIQKLFVIPQSIPYVGGEFGVQETQATFEGSVSSTGIGSLSLGGQTGFKALGSEIQGSLTGSGEFRLFPPDGLILRTASFKLKISGTIFKEQGLITAIPQLAALRAIPIIGSVVSWLDSHATLRGEISPSLEFTAAFEQQSGALEFKEGTGTLGCDLKATLQVQIVPQLSAKAWVGGGGSLTVGVPVTEQNPLLRQGEIRFQAGAELKASYIFEYTAQAVFDAKCTFTPAAGVGCEAGGSTSSATAAEDRFEEVSIIVPDYERFGEVSEFRRTPRIRTASPRTPASVQETTLVSNVFPGGSPKILAAGSGKLLLWVSQDGSKPVLQSTGISWSFDDGSGFSAPALLTDDTRAELSPVAGVDANGKVVAAWLRIRDSAFTTPITTASELPLFYTRLEVVSAVFDPATKTWGAITALTDDTAFDTDLRLSADGSGNLMLTWLSNGAGEFLSTAADPSTLRFSLWTGSAWSAPASIAAGLVGVASHAGARRGSAAFVILPRDPDPSAADDGVLDRYTWNGTTWSGASTFAAGGVENRLPSAVYDDAGAGHVVWVRGSDLVHATLAAPTPEVVRAGTGSLAFYDTELTADADGNLVLLRQDSGEQGPGNVFATIYDAASDAWSADRRITEDDWQARDLSAYFGGDGAIHAAYLATEITRVTRTVTIAGQSVQIANIPEDGQTDLRVLDHTLITDLAVADGDLQASLRDPSPGDSITATLTVHNAGDFAAGAFAVKLYVGEPASGGALVGTQNVAAPFAAGETRALSFAFTQPDAPGDLVALVDADGAVAEFSEANNRATIAFATNADPEARIIASATSGNAPLAVNFNASSSFDPNGDAMTFAWAFADGGANAAGSAVSRSFTQAGTYRVTLVATDSRGGVGTASVVVTVGGGSPPTATSISPTSGPAAGGTTITITGANFLPGATVRIGNVAATSVAWLSETTITCRTPALPAGALHDVAVTNPSSSSGTLAKGWLADFLDVPLSFLYHNAIEKILRAGITTGCGGGNYCPGLPITRDAMAAFILRGEHGGTYVAPDPTGDFFEDVETTTFLARWMEQFGREGISTGCGTAPGGKPNYCPTAAVTRDGMAVFLLRGKHGASFSPPAATGAVFGDVTTSTFLARWMEQLKAENITQGCGGGNYCPLGTVTRGEMAPFIVRTFGL
jgi:PKD repeat protein